MGVKDEGTSTARSRARRARLAILAQVVVAVALSILATWLVTWLSERRGFRARFDLTRSAENTLDPVSVAVIAKLPGEVAIDVFFRPSGPPLEAVAADAQERMRRLLRRAADESAGRIVVEEHDLSNPAKLSPRAQARMAELKLLSLEEGGLLVLSSGERREIVRLRPDIADLDPGDPGGPGQPFVPARMVGFRGEEALMSALLKVSLATTQRVYVAEGHGEPRLEAGDPLGLSIFSNELAGDGFEVRTWNGGRSGTLPDDCDVLALLGPEQIFTPAEETEIRRFVDRGGRLIAAPGERALEGTGSLAQILQGFGVRMRPRGVVARPIPDFAGGPPHYETPECGDLAIGPEGMPAWNPITEPLRRAGRRVLVRSARVLERAEVPAATPPSVRELLRADEDSWHELPQAASESQYDWKPDEHSESARFWIAAQSSFSPREKAGPRAPNREGARAESRVVVLGSVSICQNFLMPSNRDFVLNAFNWLAAREYRVKVSKQDREARRIDVKSEGALARMTWIAIVGLPLACALLGIVTVWRRNRR